VEAEVRHQQRVRTPGSAAAARRGDAARAADAQPYAVDEDRPQEEYFAAGVGATTTITMTLQTTGDGDGEAAQSAGLPGDIAHWLDDPHAAMAAVAAAAAL